MNPRPLFLAAALLAGAVPAAAGPEPLDNSKLVERMRSELAAVRATIQEQLKDRPADLRIAMGQVDAVEADFRGRLAELSSAKNYGVEVDYVRGAFEKVVLWQFQQTSAGLNKISADDPNAGNKVAVMLVDVRRRGDERLRAYDAEFLVKRNQEISDVVAARLAEAGDSTAQVLPGTRKFWQFKRLSPLIRAGVESVRNGMDGGGPSAPTPPKPPVTNPGGVVTKPGGPAPGPADPAAPPPAPDSDGPSFGDVLDRIPSVSLPSQYMNTANDALQSRRYSEAADLARLALLLDPQNGNAKHVLYSVRGRADAISAGAAGAASAAAEAQALGRTGDPGSIGREASFGAGATGSLALSPAALKAAFDQAIAAAQNADKLGDHELALSLLTKALAGQPRSAGLLFARAQMYAKLGRWEEAYQDIVAAEKEKPGDRRLLRYKGLAELRTKRHRDALATSAALLAADPKDAWAYALRGQAAGALGDRAAMRADIERAKNLDARYEAMYQEALRLPDDGDVMFLFPDEPRANAAPAAGAAAGASRGAGFSAVVAAGVAGGVLLAIGLLSVVMGPVKEAVTSAFTRRSGSATPAGAVHTAQPASVSGEVGGLIRGQYEIVRQIGAGGMGMVYEGKDRSLGRRVAIKKMRDELRQNPRERERFIIEAKTVAALRHPGIVDIYAIAEEGDDVYLVFEYVDGKTVHDLVQASGRLAPAEAVSVTRSMADALTYAHSRGVIHRDMKPSNVMLTSAGEIKVMDFGIARMAKDAMTRYSMTNTVVGTPPYMAPEQEQGVVRKESDVYALAVCAYEMLTGKLPFIGLGAGMLMNKINMSYIPPSRAIAGLPEAFDDVFAKAFQADPDKRHRTPQEFVADLSGAAGGARAKA